MGTVFSIDVRDPDADAVVDDVIAWLHHVDAIFSTYRADSDVRRLDRGKISLADCAPELSEVLERCAQARDATDGYFDIQAGGRLDPSGYVKGWAIERASDLLAAASYLDHCINGGGDVQCSGAPEPGRRWQVGITDPHDRAQLVGTVCGSPLAVATSGSAERGPHILDPHTSRPATTFTSITLVGRRLATLDAYATAAAAMGERAPDWLRRTGQTALLVRPDRSVLRIGSEDHAPPGIRQVDPR